MPATSPWDISIMFELKPLLSAHFVYILKSISAQSWASVPRGASSATSAAKAAIDTVIACESPTPSGGCFSAAIASDGAYGVPEGLICGYPLITMANGTVEIIRDVTLSEFAKTKFAISIDELESEREAVKHLL